MGQDKKFYMRFQIRYFIIRNIDIWWFFTPRIKARNSGLYKCFSNWCFENDLSNLKEKELNSKFIKEQKEKIINHFKNFKELNYDIVNSFIDYIEIGEKNKKTKSQDVIIHWNF